MIFGKLSLNIITSKQVVLLEQESLSNVRCGERDVITSARNDFQSFSCYFREN